MEDLKNQIKLKDLKNEIKLFNLLKSKARLSEEDFPRELLQSSLTKRNGMVKNVAIKSPPQSTSSIIELMVRDQKSKNNTANEFTSCETKDNEFPRNSSSSIKKILSFLQLKQSSYTKYWITRYKEVFQYTKRRFRFMISYF